ncbi:MAG: GNAT family N-acetyltransferase [Betaproteobacteria bacterium]|nr:GNAT family N-acetyltransferase [Betaproteobacteria bacterium]
MQYRTPRAALRPCLGHRGRAGAGGGCISGRPGGIWACSAEIGYWVGQAHWRRGIVSEALGLVTAWAWTALPLVMRLCMPSARVGGGGWASELPGIRRGAPARPAAAGRPAGPVNWPPT